MVCGTCGQTGHSVRSHAPGAGSGEAELVMDHIILVHLVKARTMKHSPAIQGNVQVFIFLNMVLYM